MAKGLRLWVGMKKNGICVMGREDPEIPDDHIYMEGKEQVKALLVASGFNYWDVDKQEWVSLLEGE